SAVVATLREREDHLAAQLTVFGAAVEDRAEVGDGGATALAGPEQRRLAQGRRKLAILGAIEQPSGVLRRATLRDAEQRLLLQLVVLEAREELTQERDVLAAVALPQPD